MTLLLSILLATAAPAATPENSKKQSAVIVSEDETVFLENPDDLPSQEVVIDDSFDDFFSDLDAEED